MKIKSVRFNNKKKAFEVITSARLLHFPYQNLRLRPTVENKITRVVVDKDLGREGFTYALESGAEDTVHMDHVLAYHQDTDHLRELLLYKLTVKAQKLLKSQKVSKRQVMRRLGISPTQFYRLMDQTFYHKTIDQMVKLLAALDCHIDVVFQMAA